jgi:hypothetical protein
MTAQQYEQAAQFLLENRPAITGLVQQAYQLTGGHYAALTPAESQAQAEIDSRAFIGDLLRGVPDRAAIRQRAQSASTPGIISDTLHMAEIFEKLFNAFVQARLAAQTHLARDLAQRNTFVMGRFRLSLSAAHLDSVVNGFQVGWSLAEVHIPN